jgi:hypothetical protein
MSTQSRRSLESLWTVLPAALVALSPPSALVVHANDRVRPAGQHQRMKRTGHTTNARRAPSVRAAPAASR